MTSKFKYDQLITDVCVQTAYQWSKNTPMKDELTNEAKRKISAVAVAEYLANLQGHTIHDEHADSIVSFETRDYFWAPEVKKVPKKKTGKKLGK